MNIIGEELERVTHTKCVGRSTEEECCMATEVTRLDKLEEMQWSIRLIHEFSITGSIARQPLLMADQAYNYWFFFISNKFNGYIINLEYYI